MLGFAQVYMDNVAKLSPQCDAVGRKPMVL